MVGTRVCMVFARVCMVFARVCMVFARVEGFTVSRLRRCSSVLPR